MRGVHAVIALFATFAIVSGGLSTAYDPTPPGVSSGLPTANDPTSPSSVSPSAAPPSIHGLSHNDVRIEPNSSRVGDFPGLRYGSSIPKRLQALFYGSLLIATLAMTFLVIQCFRGLSAGSPGASSPRRLAIVEGPEKLCGVSVCTVRNPAPRSDCAVVHRERQLIAHESLRVLHLTLMVVVILDQASPR